MAGNGESFSEKPVYCGDTEFVEVDSPPVGDLASSTLPGEQSKEAVDLQGATSTTADMSERLPLEEVDARVSGMSMNSIACVTSFFFTDIR